MNWLDFFGQALAAALGAAAAFGFALWLEAIVQDRERRGRLLETREQNLLTVMVAIDAAGQCMEELVNFKSQYVVSLTLQATYLEEVLRRPGISVGEVFEEARQLPTIFQEFQTLSFPSFPATDRFGFLLESVPHITMFVHRAASCAPLVNSFIQRRNALLVRYSDVARSGVPGSHDMAYFYPMLVSLTRALASSVDDSLAFSRILHDQCYYVGVEKFQRPVISAAVIPSG